MTRPTIEELEARVRRVVDDYDHPTVHDGHAALTDLAARAKEAEELIAATERYKELLDERSTP